MPTCLRVYHLPLRNSEKQKETERELCLCVSKFSISRNLVLAILSVLLLFVLSSLTVYIYMHMYVCSWLARLLHMIITYGCIGVLSWRSFLPNEALSDRCLACSMLMLAAFLMPGCRYGVHHYLHLLCLIAISFRFISILSSLFDALNRSLASHPGDSDPSHSDSLL